MKKVVQDLLRDDEFVARIARAAGMQAWANSADYPDIASLQKADAVARGQLIADLRAKLLAAFEGYDTP